MINVHGVIYLHILKKKRKNNYLEEVVGEMICSWLLPVF